jgi:hypothetical protein
MGQHGIGSGTRGASQEDPSPVDEFDGSATIVDPDAGRRAMAAIAAARGLGQNDVPTKESKNVAAALAAHERNLAEERQVSAQPTPAVGFDLRVDALQEIESPSLTLKPTPSPPRPAPLPPVLREEAADKFDIDVATGSSLSPLPPKPASRGLTLVALALIAAASGFAAFHFVGARLGLGRPAPPTASAR